MSPKLILPIIILLTLNKKPLRRLKFKYSDLNANSNVCPQLKKEY